VSSSDLIRWGGLAGMLAGVTFIVLFLVGLVIPEPLPGSFSDILTSIVFIVALLLLLVGLMGFHALQKGSYERIGRAGLYTVIVAALVQILAQVALISGNTALEFLDFLGLLGIMVGFVLYGAATLQARVLPRWCGVHRRPADMGGHSGGPGRIWGHTWGDTVRAPVAGAGVYALVAEWRRGRAARA
jgi:hypothetical protein